MNLTTSQIFHKQSHSCLVSRQMEHREDLVCPCACTVIAEVFFLIILCFTMVLLAIIILPEGTNLWVLITCRYPRCSDSKHLFLVVGFSWCDPHRWIFLSSIQPASHQPIFPGLIWKAIFHILSSADESSNRGHYRTASQKKRGRDFTASSCWLVPKKNGCLWHSKANCMHHKCKCH